MAHEDDFMLALPMARLVSATSSASETVGF